MKGLVRGKGEAAAALLAGAALPAIPALAQEAAPPLMYGFENGVMVIEAEDAAQVAPWELASDEGATGGAYLHFRGDNQYSNDGTQQGMSYCFKPEHAGNYHLRIRVRRSREGAGEVANDLRNDVWVRLQPWGANYPRPWMKLFFGGAWEEWGWGGTLDMHNYYGVRPAPVFHINKPQRIYCFEIAGRSEQVQFDRLHVTYMGPDKPNEDDRLPSTLIAR